MSFYRHRDANANSASLSVIIPIYNVKPFLTCCLKSVCEQHFTRVEVICVNDGSTDSSEELLEDIIKQDRRVRAIMQPNRGLGNARNRGLAYAKGDYIAFVDGDDWVEPEIWERLVQKAEVDNCEMVLCEGCRVDMTSGYRSRHDYESLLLPKRFFRGAFAWRDWSKRATPFASCVYSPLRICRRDFIGTLRFPERMLYEDAPFHFALFFRALRIGAVRGAFYCYRQRPGSTMGIRDVRVLNHLRVLNMVWEDLGRLNLQETLGADFVDYAADLVWKSFTMWPTRTCFTRCRAWVVAHQDILAVRLKEPVNYAKIGVFLNDDFLRATYTAKRMDRAEEKSLDRVFAFLRGKVSKVIPGGQRCLKSIIPYGLMARWMRVHYGIDLQIGTEERMPKMCALLPYGLVMAWKQSAAITSLPEKSSRVITGLRRLLRPRD